MEYRGYFKIPTNVFSLINFNDFLNSQNYILFDELENNKIYDDVKSGYVKSIQINKNLDTGYIDLLIKYQSNIPDTFLHQTLTDFYRDIAHRFGIGTYFESLGRISSDVTSAYNVLDDYFDSSVNGIFFYRMKSPKIKLDKELEFVKCEYVKYTRPITHRNVTLDVKQSASDEQYNYVYLTVLNRYYFVADAVLQNDMFVLTLKEDVLMSFKDLILQQNAFIERNEYLYNSNLVDDYVTFDFHKKKEYSKITPTNDFLDFGTGVTPSEKLQYVFITVWGLD